MLERFSLSFPNQNTVYKQVSYLRTILCFEKKENSQIADGVLWHYSQTVCCWRAVAFTSFLILQCWVTIQVRTLLTRQKKHPGNGLGLLIERTDSLLLAINNFGVTPERTICNTLGFDVMQTLSTKLGNVAWKDIINISA